MNPILTMYLQSMLQRRNQQQQHELALSRMREQQQIDTAQSLVPGIRDRSIDTAALPPEITARLGIDPSVIRGTDESAMLPFYEQTRQAKTQVEVPTIESLLGGAKAKGVDTIPQIGSERWQPETEDTLPSANRPVVSPPALQQAFDQREGQLANIDRSQELDADRAIAQAGGEAYERAKMTEKAAEEFFPAQLNRSTMEQQNKNVLEQNQFNVMTPLEASRAGQVETARESARLAPKFIDARVNEYLRAHPSDAANVTDAQARAQGFFPILMEADKGIREFEDKRVDIAMGTQTLGSIPGLNRLLSSDQKSLLQSARQYANIANLILTGVQGREEEYGRFLSTYVGYHGDDDRTRDKKRRARELFTQSVLRRAQTGTVTPAGITEVMDEVDALIANEPSYPGEPPPLPDGIATDRESLIRALEDARRR